MRGATLTSYINVRACAYVSTVFTSFRRFFVESNMLQYWSIVFTSPSGIMCVNSDEYDIATDMAEGGSKKNMEDVEMYE